MYVWNDIAKRYHHLEGFPFVGAAQGKVWNTAQTHKMPLHEAVVLLSTMDNAVIKGEDAKEVADLFAKYGEQHPDSSLSEQAEILRNAEFEPGDVAAWLQTSVSEFWGQGEFNEETEDWEWYDPATGDKHFDAFAEAKRLAVNKAA
jgi:hypothetical protein